MTTLDLAAINLPRMTAGQRLKEACKLAWRTLRTGEHIVARAYSDGMTVGMDGGYAAATGEYNARIGGTGGAR